MSTVQRTIETNYQNVEGSGVATSIGIWGAMLFGIHCISLSSSGFIPYSWVASVWPGANISMLLLIAMLLSVLHGFCYASIGTIVPRSGADYVLASRVFSPPLAFISSWILVIFSGIVVGSLIAWIPKSAIPALLIPIDMILGTTWGATVASFSSSPAGALMIGLGFVLITFVFVLRSNKWNVKVMRWGFWLMLIAWGIILTTLAFHTPADFKAAWNGVMEASQGPDGSFEKRVEIAKRAGMAFNDSFLATTLAGLIMGFWIFYGYYIPTFFAREVKNNKKGVALIWASLGSIGITGAIFILGDYFLERLVPLEWIAAEGYIFNNPAAVESAMDKPVAGYPWITFYAGILLTKNWMGIFFLFFLAVAWIWSLINLAQTYFFYTSRIILSWATDHIIPRKFKYKTQKNNVPLYCIIAVTALSMYGVWDASYNSGILSGQLTFAFFAVITQIISVMAVIIMPYRWKEQFNKAPLFIRKKFLGVYVVSIIGFFTLIYLVWMVIASFIYPASGIANPSATLNALGIIAIPGLALFLLAWAKLKKAGVYKTTFEEIPRG